MSLQDKINAWASSPSGRAKIEAKLKEYAAQGKGRTNAGSSLISEDTLNVAVSRLIRCIKANARDAQLPASVLAHIESIDAGSPVLVNGRYEVPLYFGGDLSRDSLFSTTPTSEHGFYTGSGVVNIVALFNNGYTAKAPVYGVWANHGWGARIRSRTHRDPTRFLQAAVEDFNGNYGAELNASAELAAIYTQ